MWIHGLRHEKTAGSEFSTREVEEADQRLVRHVLDHLGGEDPPERLVRLTGEVFGRLCEVDTVSLLPTVGNHPLVEVHTASFDPSFL
jgi:hypothetical protein